MSLREQGHLYARDGIVLGEASGWLTKLCMGSVDSEAPHYESHWLVVGPVLGHGGVDQHLSGTLGPLFHPVRTKATVPLANKA